MSASDQDGPPCRRCGRPIPEGERECGYCGEPAEILRPLGAPPGGARAAPPGAPSQLPPPVREPRLPPTPPDPLQEPLPPAPGQEPFGTWTNIKSTARLDPVFGVLLALLALDLIANVLVLDWCGIVLSAAVLWGVMTFQWWGYLIAMLLAGLGLLWSLAAFISGGSGGSAFASAHQVYGVAVNLFTLIVLYTRREHFD